MTRKRFNQRSFLRWRSSVLRLKPRLWQNSLRRIPLLTNSAINCSNFRTGTSLGSRQLLFLLSSGTLQHRARLSNRRVGRTLTAMLTCSHPMGERWVRVKLVEIFVAGSSSISTTDNVTNNNDKRDRLSFIHSRFLPRPKNEGQTCQDRAEIFLPKARWDCSALRLPLTLKRRSHRNRHPALRRRSAWLRRWGRRCRPRPSPRRVRWCR